LNELIALPPAELEKFVNQAASKLGPDGRMRIAENMCPGISLFTESRENVCLICSNPFATEDLLVMACCYQNEGIQIWCRSCVEMWSPKHSHKVLAETLFFTLADHVCGNRMRGNLPIAENGMGNEVVQEEPPIAEKGVAAVALMSPRVADEEVLPDGAHANDNVPGFGAEEGVALRLPVVEYRNGSKYIGSRFVKDFDKHSYIGTVVAWAANKKAGLDLWHVVYQDSVSLSTKIPITLNRNNRNLFDPILFPLTYSTAPCPTHTHPIPSRSAERFCSFQDEEDLDENELLPLISAFRSSVQTRQFRQHLAAAEDAAAKWAQVYDQDDQNFSRKRHRASDGTTNFKCRRWDETFRPDRPAPRRRNPLA
jgi:hypothetical protein